MKLRFLGTAAAEGIPAIFCECETCKKARANRGKDIRTRSQSIINDDLLIDLSADSYMHSIINNIDFTPICHCLISHSHSDHLYPDELYNRRHGFSVVRDEIHTLNLYGSELVLDQLKLSMRSNYDNLINDKAIDFHVVEPYKPFEILSYRVTAFEASHDPKSGPLFYAVEQGGKSILHANDTGIFKDSVWDYIKSSGIHFDLVSLDCTGGDMPITYLDCHMNVDACRKTKAELIRLGAADENTAFILNHFTHNSKVVIYDELSSRVKGEFDVSYDGMDIEI